VPNPPTLTIRNFFIAVQKQGGAVFVRGADGGAAVWSRVTLVDSLLVHNLALPGSTNIDGRGGAVYVSYRGNLTAFRTNFYTNDAVRLLPPRTPGPSPRTQTQRRSKMGS
jgi:hypothetical protein